ncbi:MAG: hypothetical protein GX045_05545 [Clostridiaceae bacterium]|nr:hypothetical protein [Clostridiaceae bacterium]
MLKFYFVLLPVAIKPNMDRIGRVLQLLFTENQYRQQHKKYSDGTMAFRPVHCNEVAFNVE